MSNPNSLAPSTSDVGSAEPPLGPIPFVGANPNRYLDLTGQPKRPWSLVVMHSMEAGEFEKTAENVASWFHTEPLPRTSAHYCVDEDSVVQCVQLRDVAYAAPNANRNGIHVELAGYARQTRADWLDAYGESMLPLAARLLREIVLPKTGIPPVFVDAAGLRAGHRGVTTHWEVTKAFNPGGHTDPGPGFPMDDFLAMVRGGRDR